jgi:hypothetical protein
MDLATDLKKIVDDIPEDGQFWPFTPDTFAPIYHALRGHGLADDLHFEYRDKDGTVAVFVRPLTAEEWQARDDERLEALLNKEEEEEEEDPLPHGHVGGFQYVGEIAAKVAEQGTPKYLVKRLIPEDGYGVLSAAKKVGKTWLALDLAVSVASGTPWLGIFPVEKQGSVLYYFNEGGERKVIRRLRAICEHKGVRLEELPIVLTTQVPNLTTDEGTGQVAFELAYYRPALTVLDPAYVCLPNVNLASLPEVGSKLVGIQQAAQAVDSALLIVHHNRKSLGGQGADKMSGAGFAEWGRFLLTVTDADADKKEKNAEKADEKRSDARLKMMVEGDEVIERAYKFTRTITNDNPDSLTAPLHYEVSEGHKLGDEPDGTQLTKAEAAIYGLLTGEWVKAAELIDDAAGRPKATVYAALKKLKEVGTAENENGMWRLNPLLAQAAQ